MGAAHKLVVTQHPRPPENNAQGSDFANIACAASHRCVNFSCGTLAEEKEDRVRRQVVVNVPAAKKRVILTPSCLVARETIAPGSELTINYGRGMVEFSPLLPPPSRNDGVIREGVLRKPPNRLDDVFETRCRCADCAKLDEDKRSIVLTPPPSSVLNLRLTPLVRSIGYALYTRWLRNWMQDPTVGSPSRLQREIYWVRCMVDADKIQVHNRLRYG